VGDRRFDARYSPHDTLKVAYPGVPVPEEVHAWAKGWVKWFSWEDRKPQPGHDYDGYFVGVRPEEYDAEDFCSYLNED